MSTTAKIVVPREAIDALDEAAHTEDETARIRAVDRAVSALLPAIQRHCHQVVDRSAWEDAAQDAALALMVGWRRQIRPGMRVPTRWGPWANSAIARAAHYVPDPIGYAGRSAADRRFLHARRLADGLVSDLQRVPTAEELLAQDATLRRPVRHHDTAAIGLTEAQSALSDFHHEHRRVQIVSEAAA